MNSSHRRVGRALVWSALLLGLGHAGFSLYWALGGTWLLETVGRWAVEAQTETAARIGLLVITVLKAAAAIIPAAVEYHKLPHRKFWRTIAWIGGLGITAYGAINSLTGTAVLTGLLNPAGGYDTQAMIGHAFIWDPWFLLWGLTLITSLALTRPRLNHQHQ